MNIEDMVQEIVGSSGKTRDEVQELIHEKRKKLKMIITEEAAAKLVAKDLGINLSPETQDGDIEESSFKIVDVLKVKPGGDPVTVTGIVKRMYLPRVFSKKTGGQGKVLNLLLDDGSEAINVVLWGNHVDRIEKESVERGDCLRIIRGSVKQGRFNLKELHVGDYSQWMVINSLKGNYPDPSSSLIKFDQLDDLAVQNKEIDTLAGINALGQERKFTKKDGSEGSIAWLNIFDETNESIRFVLWNERSQEAGSFKTGDKILIEGGFIRESRNGGYEIHAGQKTRITKKGTTTVPDSIKKIAPVSQSSASAVKLKLNEIDTQSSIEVVAIVAGKQPVRNFTRKDGSPGQVARLLLYDGTVYLPMVIWNEKAQALDDITVQSTVKVTNCYARDRDGQVELHLSNNGDIIAVPDSNLKSTMTFNKIADISTDQSLVNLRGKIVSLGEPTSFERSDNTTGRVRSLQVKDETGDVRIVAWDRKVDELNMLMVNEVIEVILGKVRKRDDHYEIHLTGFSSIITLTDVPPELEEITSFSADSMEKNRVQYERIPIDTVQDGSKIQIRGKIVSVYRWKPFFHACPVCSKKANTLADQTSFECGEHGIVDAKPRMKFTTVIDDNYGTLRIILFGKSAAIASGLTAEPLMELFDSQQEDEMHRIIQKSMLGKEFIFTGEVRDRIVDQAGETLAFKEMIARRVSTPDPVKEFDLLLATIED